MTSFTHIYAIFGRRAGKYKDDDDEEEEMRWN